MEVDLPTEVASWKLLLKCLIRSPWGDRSAINPNIRSGVYAVALKPEYSRRAYESLLLFARETKIADEYQAAVRGLGNTRDPAIVQVLLELILTDEFKPQDVRMLPQNELSLLTLRSSTSQC
jgi:hypothetical protein